MPRFTPPTTRYGNVEPASRVEMWFGNQVERGLTLLKKDGVYTLIDFPYQGDCDDADIVYLGGHVYDITEDEATALYAAGYGGTPPDPSDPSDPGDPSVPVNPDTGNPEDPTPGGIIYPTWDSLDNFKCTWDTLGTWDEPV